MTSLEDLIQAAMAAPEDRKAAALRILRGEDGGGNGAPEYEAYLTLRETAKRLGVSACSLWRWDVQSIGHGLGGRTRYKLSEVVAYLESDDFKMRAGELREERSAARNGAPA